MHEYVQYMKAFYIYLTTYYKDNIIICRHELYIKNNKICFF